MPNIILPFDIGHEVKESELEQTREELRESLPETLCEVAEQNSHLFDYLCRLPISQVGMPEYLPELSRKMAEVKVPNIIYPIKQDGIFVHILFDEGGYRHHYIPIEPTTTLKLETLSEQIEDACIAISEKIPGINPEIDREKHLLKYLDDVTANLNKPRSKSISPYLWRLRRKEEVDPLKNVRVSKKELEGIRYLFLRDKVRMGVLDTLVTDPYIEDISCSGTGHIFIEHKVFKSLKSTVNFINFDDLDEYVIELAERIRKPVTYKNPIADATLPDGSRINIVYGRDVSKRGSNFSIRKFSEVPLSIFEILEFGSINYHMLAYLSLMISNGMNVFVAGESASGKTSLLNAVTAFIPPLAKIITIEDTPELQVPHQNWIREVVQSTKAEDSTGAVTMFDLLKAALRQRPNEIIVGEIRGKEGNIAFQAMQTGHSVMATFHAASIEKLIQRITGDPISVPKAYIDNLNVAVLTGMVRLPNGKNGRRITSIAEIVGWEPSTQSFNISEAFHYDESKDNYAFTGLMSSYLLEHKIAPRLGIPNNKKQKIYDEIERRANILKELHTVQKIRGFYEVLDVLSRAQRQGLF
ncbi:MAG: type II/IV secretion system ATPase subunit [Dehalococcoidales bacterium]|nr:type II/IV secretion system ATPase subunit [Dehalococcoidales bacterium]